MKNLNRIIVLMLTLTLLLCVSFTAKAAEATLPLLNTYAKEATVTLINPDTNTVYEIGEGENAHIFSKDDDIIFRIDFEPTGSNYVYGDNKTNVLHAIREAYLQQFGSVVDGNGNQTKLPAIDENTVFTIPFTTSANMNLSNVPTSPDATGNIAYDSQNRPIFSWWLDKETDQVCIRFTKEALEGTFEIENLYVGVQGTLNFDELGGESRAKFEIAGDKITLKLAVQYELDKDVKLVLNNATGKYEAQYTLTMDLNRTHYNSDEYPIVIRDVAGSAIGSPSNIKLSSSPSNTVQLTSKDNGSGSTDFILIGSGNNNPVTAGEYVITYTAPLSDEWTNDKIEDSSINWTDTAIRRNDATVYQQRAH